MNGYITKQECEKIESFVTKRVDNMEKQLARIENRFWWVITLLVGNLVGIVVLLLKGKV